MSAPFIELTEPNGLKVWVNAAHILSVRNAGSGASTVVILSAGPEHRVKEDPQAVIELARAALAGSPPPGPDDR